MLAAVLALLVAAPADPPKEKELSAEAKKELKKLDGLWRLAKEVRPDGEKEYGDDGAGTIEFKGRKALVNSVAKFEFTVADLDPATDPKLLDLASLTDAGPIHKGDVFEAVYKLDGDTLTIALYLGGGKKRPANFDPPKDDGASLLFFKRVKEDPAPAPAAYLLTAAAADPPKELPAEAKKELKQFAGKWKVDKISLGGQEVGELEADCEFDGPKMTVTTGKGKKETYEVAAIDPKTDPKCIDLVEKRQGRPDRTVEGVYQIDGDTLLIALCIPREGKQRPVSFDKPDDRTMIWTLKRVKE